FGVLGLFDLYVVLMLLNLPFLIRYVARTHFPNTIDSNKRRSLADWFVIGLQAVSIEVLTIGLSVIAMLWFSRNYLAAQSTGHCQSDRQSSKWTAVGSNSNEYAFCPKYLSIRDLRHFVPSGIELAISPQHLADFARALGLLTDGGGGQI